MNGWKLVPVEPTYQMSEAMGVKWEQGDGFPARWKAALAAAPTPPAREDVPVAWLIPRIMKMPGNPEIDGTVAWEACVFCDTRVHPRVDKNGSEFYPKPLYTCPADDKLRKVAEETVRVLDRIADRFENLAEGALAILEEIDSVSSEEITREAIGNLRAALEQK